MTVSIFLADDHAVVRDGLRLLLETQPDFKVVGEAESGVQAISRLSKQCADVLIIDIAMPELNGIEAARQISLNCPDTRVIILSMHSNPEYISRALQAGAHGYVLKSSVGAEVIKAIRAVLAGHRYLSQKVSDLVVDDYLVAIPPNLTPGFYHIIVGLYRPDTVERLTLENGQDHWLLPWTFIWK